MAAVNPYVTDSIISSIRRRAFASQDDESFSTADTLAMINEALVSEIVPMIIEARENHFIVTQNISLSSGQSAVTIPSAAVGSDLFNLVLLDSSNNPYSLAEDDLARVSQFIPLTRSSRALRATGKSGDLVSIPF